MGSGWIELERIPEARADAAAARNFGAALACTHDAGARGFGAPPDDWDGPCFIGRQPLPVSRSDISWGAWYVSDRVLPYLERAVDRGHVTAADDTLVRRACARITAGNFDDGEPPARIHGDLWNGNVLWSADGAVLIDPAAHGGHRETDLAMLALFGCPHLDQVLSGYESTGALKEGWQKRIPVHQLHPLAVHAASHGRSYAAPLTDAARAVLAL